MDNHAAIALALIITGALSACAPGNVSSDFQCDAQFGTPCATISQADSGVSAPGGAGGVGSRGDGQRQRSFPHGGPVAGPQPIPFVDEPILSNPPQTVVAGNALYGPEVVNPVLFRTPERVTTVWIAPFVGENGYLYQPGYVHFVVESGKWFGPGQGLGQEE